jgi:hypothetical protein
MFVSIYEQEKKAIKRSTGLEAFRRALKTHTEILSWNKQEEIFRAKSSKILLFGPEYWDLIRIRIQQSRILIKLIPVTYGIPQLCSYEKLRSKTKRGERQSMLACQMCGSGWRPHDGSFCFCPSTLRLQYRDPPPPPGKIYHYHIL